MIFLGQASNYKFSQAIGQIFAHGTKRDAEALESDLLQRYSGKAVRLYHTGRSALAAAFRELLPDGGPVIIPGLTCIALVRAASAAGCQPVYVDIDRHTLQYDFTKLESTLATQKTIKSIDNKDNVCYNGIIVAQNTLGLPLDMVQLEKLAKKYHFVIVEDLAHSAGRHYPDGREIGTVGVATALSFGKGKAIDTIEGGALVMRAQTMGGQSNQHRPKLSDRLRDRWYPLFGFIIRAGYHVKLGKILTGILLKLGWIKRSADAELDEAVTLMSWQAKSALKQLKRLPATGALREPIYVKHRDELLSKLEKSGFYLNEIWYDTPVSPVRYAKEAGFPVKDCPATVQVAREIINLPTWYSAKKLAPARAIISEYQLGMQVAQHKDMPQDDTDSVVALNDTTSEGVK